ncbi:TPA: ABC transporter substrate-binding protein [Stenotrophomonas maltophilia]|uniref:ABC transporter substrate-binding protein n=1 Tax=Stenotrophomonas TaxID=40323 RepID=UPI00131144D7|nr:ABC transporter substrate-binding protein [Stenotrophomonas sp. Sm6012]MBH1365727.1 ABC transporter substrate-binding protein [Stenotrophomonas maltophilia]MDQ7283241.1 ABC transporter substrate-binding protein [Stenotrophomonas sp. Sm6012]HEL3181831.1 ABC transporter substrate-binding protein [Stenotrophomonas maltophilia]
MRLAALTLAVAAALVAGGCNRIGAGMDAGKAASLEFDKPVSGEITTRSGINFNDGSHHQLYQIKLDDKDLVGLKLTGRLSGSIAVFNNGSLVSTSTTVYEREGDVSLAFRANGGGTYQVAVNADGPSAFGPYRLRAEKLKPYDGKPLVGSGEIVDMLDGDAQDYTLQVEKEGLYEIRLVSDVFDPVLKVSGQGVDAENDDGGDSTNSRLSLSLKPGKYTLSARGLGDDVNGMFTLSATRIELPGNLVERDGTPLPTSGSVYTMLDSEGRRRFLLTLDRAADVRLDAISSQVDTVLRVVGANVELSDDDGGNGTNARLQETLPAGHYTVDVTSLNNGAGLVEVRVQVDGASAEGVAASAARAAADAAAVADDEAAVEAVSR